MVGVCAACHAAHVQLDETGTGEHAAARRTEGQAGDQLGVVAECRDVLLLELGVAQHLDADRDFLQVLDALLRGHGHGGERGGLVLGCRLRGGVLRMGLGHDAQCGEYGECEHSMLRF